MIVISRQNWRTHYWTMIVISSLRRRRRSWRRRRSMTGWEATRTSRRAAPSPPSRPGQPVYASSPPSRSHHTAISLVHPMELDTPRLRGDKLLDKDSNITSHPFINQRCNFKILNFKLNFKLVFWGFIPSYDLFREGNLIFQIYILGFVQSTCLFQKLYSQSKKQL
jgi:hypothetical protein